MIRSRLALPVVVVAVAIVVAGCAPPVHPHGSGHTSDAGSTPSASATSTPTPTKPALSDLVLTADGLGDIAINAPVPPTTLLASLNPTACVSSETGVAAGDPDAGAWLANYPRATTEAGTQDVFVLETHNGVPANPVDVIWVWAPGIHTDAGIQVGSTLSDVQAAYPHPTSLQHGAVSDVYVVTGTVGKLDIEVARSDSSDAGYWTADQAGKVLWMGALGPGMPPGPIAASDGGPSSCFASNHA